MLHHKPLKRLRALTVLQMRVAGLSKTEIAKRLNIHPETVKRDIQFADKAQLFLDYEKQIFDQLVPSALKAVHAALEDGDAETGLEILRAMGILKDPKAQKTPTEAVEADELQKAIEEARLSRALEADTLDGTILATQLLQSGRSSFAGLLEGPVEATEAGPDARGHLKLTDVEIVAEEAPESDLQT